MAKKQINKLKTSFISFVCLLVGIVVGFVASIYLAMPDSYSFPQKSTGSSHVHTTGEIDVDVVKSQELSIHFIELGNKYTGDCTFVKVGNTEMLIDAGSRATSVPFIKQYIDTYCSDGKLEYVVVTHAHQDHYAGFATNNFEDSIFADFEVENIIQFAKTNQNASKGLYKNYLENIAEEGANIYSALDCVNQTNGANREYILSEEHDVSFEILYHKYYEETAPSENDYSVCIQVVHGEKKFLFTGDLETEGEESLVEENKVGGKNEGMLSQVELYKAGHHGSKTSSSDELLEVIKPKVVCVCCCAGSSEYTSKNENQFPTQAFINRVSKHTSNIYVTTLCVNYSENKFESFNGNIVVCSTGTASVSLQMSNNSTKLKDTEWFKANRTLPDDAVA